MSFTRSQYDSCSYAKDIQESTSPLEYFLFAGKYENCKNCPVGQFTNILPFGPKTDVESELFGLTREQTRCPEKKYNPNKPGPKADFSPPIMCQSIYNITPTNMKMPTSNGLNNKVLGTNCCANRK